MKDEDFASFAKKNHFIWGPEPEIYGGSAGLYSYGLNGKLLKNKIENRFREIFILNDFWEIETPLITPEAVWNASGHLEKFVDKILVCSKCNSMVRADNFIEKQLKIDASSFTDKKILETVTKKNLKCPRCNGRFLEEVRHFNLMMKTNLGFEDAYIRPETATTTYLPFKNFYDFFRKKLPFGVFQIGKAFRNEVSPRQNILRMREFTQAEAQLFIFENEKNKFSKIKNILEESLPLIPVKARKKRNATIKQALKEKWILNKALAWAIWLSYEYALSLGIPKNRIRFRQHAKEEMAHYAEDAWDLEVRTENYGWIEVIGNHDRGNFDLKQHGKFSGQNMSAEGKVPGIVEIAAGIDRLFFCLIENSYVSENVNGRKRAVLKFKPKVAPIQAAVFPLQLKDKLPELARKIYLDLKNFFPGFTIIYDEAGSIGKRYRRMDEVGTPFCITIDYDSLKDKDVTIRDRDSMKQKRVKIIDLPAVLSVGLSK